MVYEPLMSHSASFMLGALILLVYWDGRRDLSLARAALLGALIGIAGLVRSQNGILLLLPAVSLALMARRGPLRALARSAALLGACALANLPQLLAWKAIFGSYLLLHPPQGESYLQLGHPRLLETLFSSRHGLLYWTPVLWLGLLGLGRLARMRPVAALRLVLPLAAMTYVNACIADWWGGGSFSNRRFDSVLPILAIGLALGLDWAHGLVARRPMLVLAGGGALLLAWNALLMHQYARAWIPADSTLTLDQLAGNAGRGLRESVGTPLAWPANWLFGLRHGLPPGHYDLMVGKYLFHRQNSVGGVVDVGASDPQADRAFIGEGWTPRQRCGASTCRAIEGRAARLFVALDEPEALGVTVRASGQGTLGLAVNGRSVASWPLTGELRDLRVDVPARLFLRDLNELTLALSPADASCQVDQVAFRQVSGLVLRRRPALVGAGALGS
jgi:hypothetical protein